MLETVFILLSLMVKKSSVLEMFHLTIIIQKRMFPLKTGRLPYILLILKVLKENGDMHVKPLKV